MHYGHIASDTGGSTCERSLLSFVICVDFIYEKNIPFRNMIDKG